MVGRSIGKSTPRDKPALIKGIRQGGYTYTIQRFASNKEKYNAAIIWAFGTAPPPSHALKADWISMRSSSNSPSRGRFPYSWRVKRFSYSTKRGNAPYALAQGWGSKRGGIEPKCISDCVVVPAKLRDLPSKTILFQDNLRVNYRTHTYNPAFLERRIDLFEIRT